MGVSEIPKPQIEAEHQNQILFDEGGVVMAVNDGADGFILTFDRDSANAYIGKQLEARITAANAEDKLPTGVELIGDAVTRVEFNGHEDSETKHKIENIFGISLTGGAEMGNSIEVTFPGVDKLNEQKKVFVDRGIVNDGVFVEHQGGFITPEDFVAYFAKGDIPVASDPDFKTHDMLVHAAGFSVLAPSIFSMLKEVAGRAERTKDPVLQQLTIDFAEAASATATTYIADGLWQASLRRSMDKLDWSLVGMRPPRQVNGDGLFAGFTIAMFERKLGKLAAIQDKVNKKVIAAS